MSTKKLEPPTCPCPYIRTPLGRNVSYGAITSDKAWVLVAELEHSFKISDAEHTVEWLEYELKVAKRNLKKLRKED